MTLQNAQHLGGMRSDLKEHLVQEVERAIEWLKLCEQTEKADRHQTSYGLKHEAERWCRGQGHPNGYVSNGACLADGGVHARFQSLSADKTFKFPERLSQHLAA